MDTERDSHDFDLFSELTAFGLDASQIGETLDRLGGQTSSDNSLVAEPGYLDRITRGTQRRVSDRDALFAVVDLFGLAFHTTKELMLKDNKQ